MKRKSEEKLMWILQVYTLMERWITKADDEIAKDLKWTVEDVKYNLEVLQDKGQIRVWEQDGQRYISIFQD